MDNRNLERGAQSISGIVDDLISEVETLEGIVKYKDYKIEQLNDKIEQLQEQINDLQE